MKESTDQAERRRQLLGVKLRALVGDHVGAPIESEATAFGAGAACLVGDGAWVLIDGAGQRRLGAALAWAVRHGATSLDLIVEEDGGVVARRAAGFDFPIAVWFPEDRTLLPIVANPLDAVPEPSDEHLALVSMIEEAGATPVVERGVVTGEVRGLEVCRVVDEPTTGNFVEMSDVVPPETLDVDRTADGVILEVGVGANDREAFQMLHGHVPTVEALAGVVSAVEQHRSLDVIQHPLNRMAQERFLRWQAIEDPPRIGLTSVAVADPPVPRLSMKHAEPCVAVGTDAAGNEVAVVFSSGVDLELTPFVADVLAMRRAPDRVLVAVPERDLLAITGDLIALLKADIELVALPAD